MSMPDDAVRRAAIALHDLDCPDRTCEGPALGHYYQQARVALSAAGPLFRSAEQRRWRIALAEHRYYGGSRDGDPERYQPLCRCHADLGWHESIDRARQAWDDHVVAVAAS